MILYRNWVSCLWGNCLIYLFFLILYDIYYLLPPKWKPPTWKNHSFEDGNGTHAALLSFWILLSFILCKFFFKKDSFQKSTAKFLRIQQCSLKSLWAYHSLLLCQEGNTINGDWRHAESCFDTFLLFGNEIFVTIFLTMCHH